MSGQVPEEAVRVLAQSLWWAERDYGQALGADWADVGGERRERLYDHARFALAEAAPAIRSQAIQELEEELTEQVRAFRREADQHEAEASAHTNDRVEMARLNSGAAVWRTAADSLEAALSTAKAAIEESKS